MVAFRRVSAGACLAAVALSACGAGGDTAADTESAAPTPREASAPTPTPTPEPVEETEVEVPLPDLTLESEADIERVVSEILQFRAWLFGHPDQRALVTRIYWRECGCHEHLTSDLADFADQGRRVVGRAPFDVVSVEVTSSTQNSRSVNVTFRPPPAVVYGPDGSVVNEADDYFPAISERWVLAGNPEDGFRLLQATSG